MGNILTHGWALKVRMGLSPRTKAQHAEGFYGFI